MKVTSLIENTSKNPELFHEHGLSLLIESKGKTILFDSGQSGNFTLNAYQLGIDLTKVDYAILSHGHYDHGNGLKAFLKENKKAKIYLNKNSFKDYYHLEKYIGLDKTLKSSNQLIFTEDEFEIEPGITLITCNEKELIFPLDNQTLLVQDSGLKPDEFKHEHYLKIKENGKTILFSGCSHKGILNIMNWLEPDILIGGFHLMEVKMDREGKAKLDEIANKLIEHPTQYYTCHCTGKKQFPYLKNKMGNQLEYLSTGDTIYI